MERDPQGYLKLGSHPDCAEDVHKLCHEVNRESNFAVLVCLQDKAKEDELSDVCHQHLWEYKQNLTEDVKFADAAKQLCFKTLQEHPDCAELKVKSPREIVPCLLEVRQNVTENKCKNFLTKMQAVYFSDFRLIKGFVDACKGDIKEHKCGRIEAKDEEDTHSQNEVLECLEDHQETLKPECQHQILRIAELSADDYHLDRPLYYACRDDREHLCTEVPAGDGKVYQCLMENKFDKRMSSQCRHQLTLRQKLQQEDPKVDFPLIKNCQRDIDQYQCDGKGETPHGKLAHLMLCLEGAINEGKQVDGKCQEEMFKIRQQLMEDHSVNPEIVRDCEREIATCHAAKEETESGKTIDCLMKLAEQHSKDMSKKCEKAISVLLRETEAGSDYRMDHTLYKACQPVVQTLCKDKGKKDGDVMVLSCLMENLHSKHMPSECEEQLMHMQFFVSRDFRLDPDLYKACRVDAEKICHAPKWEDTNSELPGGMVVACLYRNSLDEKLSKDCSFHVQRVMHQRAVDVKLLPHVQEACMKDLGKHCSENTEAGKEIDCLQDNYETLDEECREAIGNFTEEEAEDIDLDKTLANACSGMVNKFCEDVQGDHEEILPCLIHHKSNKEMNEKCRAAIEHWQLIEMKDFSFTPKFKEKCRDDVRKHCQGQIKTKFDVVKCLSSKVRDAVLGEKSHIISEECRKQLRVEKMEIAENIKFDPDLYGACTDDAHKFCAGVQEGQAKVLECLKDNEKQLSKKCNEELFQREKEEMEDPELDFYLFKTCERMIMKFCDDVNPSEILGCLEKHKNEKEMELKCRQEITKRQIIQAKDPMQLDMDMIKECKDDVHKFCSDVKDPSHGAVMACLKKHIKQLSEECEAYVRTTMHDAAEDYRLDPALADACEGEIKRHCGTVQPGHGKVENCLKKKFRAGELKNTACKQEVARTVHEGRTDIFADPILADACSLDIRKHCVDIAPGQGKVIQCLKVVRESRGHKLSSECNTELGTRMKMWAAADTVIKADSLGDIALAVSSSPSRNYFFIVFATCLGLIFLGGLVFGRLSKRVRREYKDR